MSKRNSVSKKLQQFMYSFNTNDRYADYDSNDFPASSKKNHHNKSTSDLTEYVVPPIGSGKPSKRSSFFSTSKLTSPILDNSFNSPKTALSGDFDIQNEGVSETILAWRHIELWLNKNHEELAQTLNPGVTKNDIPKAEQDLNVEFPPSVVTSLRIHDGQDFTGSFKDYSGLFYTLELMSLDKIVEMTRNWRKVSDKINGKIVQRKLNEDVLMSLKSPELTHETKFHKNLNNKTNRRKGPDHSVGYQYVETYNHEINPNLENDLKRATLQYDVSDKVANLSAVKSALHRQSSIPPNTVHDAYAHRDWIPMLTDNAGNHVAVDLSPAANGKYGQVILFGREFDTKYVVAPTWGDFLLNFAKDLESGNYLIRSEELIDDIMASDGDLYFYDKKTRIEKNYFDILKERTIFKYNEKKHGQKRHGFVNEARKSRSGSTASPDFDTSDLSNMTEQNDISKNYSYDETELLDIDENPAIDNSVLLENTSYQSHIDDSIAITNISFKSPAAPESSANPYLDSILHQDEDGHSSRVSSTQQFSSEASSTTATSISNNYHENHSTVSNSTYLPNQERGQGTGLQTVKMDTLSGDSDYSKSKDTVELKLSLQFENVAI